MPRSLALTACLLAIALAASTWIWWPRESASIRADKPDNPISNPASSSRDADDTDVTQISNTSRPNATQTNPAKVLRLQLRGQHRDNPWTTPLNYRLSDRSRAISAPEKSAAVTSDGLCIISLPNWWRAATRVTLRIDGDNDGYVELDYHQRRRLDPDQILELDVQPIASLAGKVTDSRGQPIEHARISAFETRADQPFGESLGTASTNKRGHFLINLPPDVPLLITATAMQSSMLALHDIAGVTDNGRIRADLLPAGLPLKLAMDPSRPDCDFILGDAAIISGQVQWPNREPVAGAEVRFACKGKSILSLGPNTSLAWRANGSLVACGIAKTDRRGRLRIPSQPLSYIDLTPIAMTGSEIIGDLITQSVVAPNDSVCTVPFPVILRAIHNGQLVPFAHILMEGIAPQRAREDGTLTAVITSGTNVRAEQGSLRSEWQCIASNHLLQTIDLTMVNELVSLKVDFEGDLPVHDAAFSWLCEDGRKSTSRLQRSNQEEPFELHLEAGKYEVTVGPASGKRNGLFLLPIKHRLTVPKNRRSTAPLKLTLSARFGGILSLQVLDENGRFLAGQCTIQSPGGNTRSLQMSPDSLPGTFHAEVSTCLEVLPPGSYKLVVNLDKRGTHTRYFTIKKCETASVVFRL